MTNSLYGAFYWVFLRPGQAGGFFQSRMAPGRPLFWVAVLYLLALVPFWISAATQQIFIENAINITLILALVGIVGGLINVAFGFWLMLSFSLIVAVNWFLPFAYFRIEFVLNPTVIVSAIVALVSLVIYTANNKLTALSLIFVVAGAVFLVALGISLFQMFRVDVLFPDNIRFTTDFLRGTLLQEAWGSLELRGSLLDNSLLVLAYPPLINIRGVLVGLFLSVLLICLSSRSTAINLAIGVIVTLVFFDNTFIFHDFDLFNISSAWLAIVLTAGTLGTIGLIWIPVISLIAPLWTRRLERATANGVPILEDHPLVAMLSLRPSPRFRMTRSKDAMRSLPIPHAKTLKELARAGAEPKWFNSLGPKQGVQAERETMAYEQAAKVESLDDILDFQLRGNVTGKITDTMVQESALKIPFLPEKFARFAEQANQLRKLNKPVERTVNAAQIIREIRLAFSPFQQGIDYQAALHLRRLIHAEAIPAVQRYAELYAPLDTARQLLEVMEVETSTVGDPAQIPGYLQQKLQQIIAIMGMADFAALENTNELPDAEIRLIRTLQSNGVSLIGAAQTGILDFEAIDNLLLDASRTLTYALQSIPTTRTITTTMPDDTPNGVGLTVDVPVTSQQFATAVLNALNTTRQQLVRYLEYVQTSLITSLPRQFDSLAEMGSLRTLVSPYLNVRLGSVTNSIVSTLEKAGTSAAQAAVLPLASSARLALLKDMADTVGGLQSSLSTLQGLTGIEPLRASLQAGYHLIETESADITTRQTTLRQNIQDSLTKITDLETLAATESLLSETSAAKLERLWDMAVTGLAQVAGDVRAAIDKLEVGSVVRLFGIRAAYDRASMLRARVNRDFIGSDVTQWTDWLTPIVELLFRYGYESEDEGTAFEQPYVVGGVIDLTLEDLFKGRTDLRDQVLIRLRGVKPPPLVLYGPRRMGKTSFLRQLPRLLPANFVPITYDAQDAGATQSDMDFFFVMAQTIYEGIDRLVRWGRLTLQRPVIPPDEAAFQANAFRAIGDWLKRSAFPAIGMDNYLFLVIDEFEKIGDAIAQGKLSREVLGKLRSIFQGDDYAQLRLMFCGVATIDQLAPPDMDNPFVNAQALSIDYLDRQSAESLIRTPMKTRIKLPDYEQAAVDEIIRMTCGQPFLIQAVCEKLLDIASKAKTDLVTVDMLQTAYDQVYEKNSVYFSDLWKLAGRITSKTGQDILLALLDGPGTLEGFNLREAETLRRYRMIRRTEDKLYEIEIPMFREWIVGNEA